MALDDLAKLLKKSREEPKSKEGSLYKREKDLYESEDVEKIVKKIQQKYTEQGIIKERAGGQLGALRGIITSEESDKGLRIEDPSAILKAKSPTVKAIGSLYLQFGASLEGVSGFLKKLPGAQDLEFDLYSANIQFSSTQFLGLAATGVVLVTLLFAVLNSIFVTVYLLPLTPAFAVMYLLSPLLAFVVFAVLALRVPKIIAFNRAKEMATQIKSGTSLHRTLQTLSQTDYGVFSEEIGRTLREMDEGLSTEAALENLKTRTSSKVLRRVILHVLRALRTGGQLSAVLASIAEQVADDLLVKIREFSEKINFIGVVYIVGCIVAPVLVAVLGGIRNAPLGFAGSANLFEAIPLTPVILSVFYLFLFPLLLFAIAAIVKAAEPVGV